MNRIKDLRLEKGWTQMELAAMLTPKNQQAISKLERNEIDLNTDDIRRLCEIFGCTSDYLLGFSSARSPKISDEDAELLEAYHAAGMKDRKLVDEILEEYKKKKITAAG